MAAVLKNDLSVIISQLQWLIRTSLHVTKYFNAYNKQISAFVYFLPHVKCEHTKTVVLVEDVEMLCINFFLAILNVYTVCEMAP